MSLRRKSQADEAAFTKAWKGTNSRSGWLDWRQCMERQRLMRTHRECPSKEADTRHAEELQVGHNRISNSNLIVTIQQQKDILKQPQKVPTVLSLSVLLTNSCMKAEIFLTQSTYCYWINLTSDPVEITDELISWQDFYYLILSCAWLDVI